MLQYKKHEHRGSAKDNPFMEAEKYMGSCGWLQSEKLWAHILEELEFCFPGVGTNSEQADEGLRENNKKRQWKKEGENVCGLYSKQPAFHPFPSIDQ